MTIPEAELQFKESYAQLIHSSTLSRHQSFKICPTASNSIDIVGAVLQASDSSVGLVEPTFDNLALLLRRRGVRLKRNREHELIRHVRDRTLDRYEGFFDVDALFLVNPNNPTGTILDAEDFRYICRECRRYDKRLIVDNCFRLFNRNPYDDYKILAEENVAFISIEDTGKVWPTLDMKASLLVYSTEFAQHIEEIYNEIYLCASPFSLVVLAALNNAACTEGLAEVLWRKIDEHRAYLRSALKGTPISFETPHRSELSVEWLNCSRTGLSDIEVRKLLEQHGVMVLPGRHFYWYTAQAPEHHQHIRVSLLKRTDVFHRSVDIISRCFRSLVVNTPDREPKTISASKATIHAPTA